MNTSMKFLVRSFRRDFSSVSSSIGQTQKTALYDFHLRHGAKMTEFAGWSMPLTYSGQSHLQSHLHTRDQASLFDVSHMLHMEVLGRDRISFLEHLILGDLVSLPDQHTLLSLFTNERGGIKDDVLLTKLHDRCLMITNAACASKITDHLQYYLEKHRSSSNPIDVTLLFPEGKSLLALQGPKSARILSTLTSENLNDMSFMTSKALDLRLSSHKSLPVRLTRCGYTGEDGFEILVDSHDTEILADSLLSRFPNSVKLAGLACRDSLRLEAGLCLYGKELDEDITPIEAGLAWCLSKRRRQDLLLQKEPISTESSFLLGAEVIKQQLLDPSKLRKRLYGFELIEQGSAPARSTTPITNEQGVSIGMITSGSPSPSLGKNIAMGYIDSYRLLNPGTEVFLVVRGAPQKAQIVKLPFLAHRYHRKK